MALQLRIFPKDLIVKLKIRALKTGKSLNQLIIDICTEYVSKYKD
jgi:predicted HicB family RNase H-like nuclease